MFEVEIKVRILDPDLMREKFENQNGVYKLSLTHEDTYVNMPEGLRDFKSSDEALRIRKSIQHNKNEKEKEHILKYYITYKGKKIDTMTKTRQEIEIEIEDGGKMMEILKALGFQEIYTVKKERELYEFSFRDYHIEALIDYLPILKQYFIEVECILASKDELDDAREILFEFLDLFDIKKEESIRESYLELIAERFRKKIKN